MSGVSSGGGLVWRHGLERPAVDLWPDELEPLVVEAYRCGSHCSTPHCTVLDRLEERVVEAYC